MNRAGPSCEARRPLVNCAANRGERLQNASFLGRGTGPRHHGRNWVLISACLALAWFGLAGPSAAEDPGHSVRSAALAPAAAQAPEKLPQVLSQGDESLYREIFALQEQGRWQAADARIARLTDRRLLGHVMAQRYLHPTAYRSKYGELKEWLAHYADHPEAKRIYKLALKRRPANAERPRKPVLPGTRQSLGAIAGDTTYRSTKRLSKSEQRAARQLKRQVRRNVLRTRLTITEKLLEGSKARRLLDQVEIDDGLAQVAAAWFYYGNDAHAYRLASTAAGRSGAEVPLADWTAGLAAWRLGRIESATMHFERMARAPRLSDWNIAAGAYWAARGHLRLKQPERMSEWLAIAARHPRTFYGLMAQRALGVGPRFAFHTHDFGAETLGRLEATPATARALALVQVGQTRRAETELRRLAGRTDPAMTEGLLTLAERAHMPELAFRLGNSLAASDHGDAAGPALDAALYPIPPWRPASGFSVDRALIYAFIRQESGFNPTAKSPDGARGLMQLMPATASFVARDRGYRRSKRNELYDPATNLELGQRYLNHLLGNALVQGDLARLTTAYNGGPGNLQKWQRKMAFDGDPLMFIESLPSRETRLFIERVLTNLWIYRARLGQPTPSLDGIASGDWPYYVPLDVTTRELASNAPN